jgi:hypothetical protein
LKQKDYKLKVNLNFLARPCLKTTKKQKDAGYTMSESQRRREKKLKNR